MTKHRNILVYSDCLRLFERLGQVRLATGETFWGNFIIQKQYVYLNVMPDQHFSLSLSLSLSLSHSGTRRKASYHQPYDGLQFFVSQHHPVYLVPSSSLVYSSCISSCIYSLIYSSTTSSCLLPSVPSVPRYRHSESHR